MRVQLQLDVKLKIYNEALAYYKDYPTYCDGMCPVLLEAAGFVTASTDYDIIPDLFPEVWAQKPAVMYTGSWWFSHEDVESRIEVLTNAIKEVVRLKSLNYYE